MLSQEPMSAKVFPRFHFFLVLFCLLWSLPTFAQAKKIGLATYDVVSGENVDYLKKVVRESLTAALAEEGSFSVVEVQETEEDLKKKGVAQTAKKEGLQGIVAGSIVKVGSPIQINTRIYRAGEAAPISLSVTAENPDRLLPTIKTHARAIVMELNKAPAVGVATPRPEPLPTPTATKETLPATPTTPSVEKAGSGKRKEKGPAKAQGPETIPSASFTAPDYRWMSDRLPMEGRGLAYADLQGSGTRDVVVIDLNRVFVYSFDGKQVRLRTLYQGRKEDRYVRVYAMDVEGDGKSEILISSIRDGQAASLGLKDEGGELKPFFKDAPWLLKVMEWEGKPLLIGEPFYGREVDLHKISKLNVIDGKLKEAGEFDIPKKIGLYGVKEFKAKEGEASGLVYLTPSGSLQVYEGPSFDKRASSSDHYGGTSNFINTPLKSMFNEVQDYRTYINLDPVAWRDSDGRGAIVVAKNDDFLKGIIGTKPIVKNCWLTKLKWEDLGLREAFSTRKIDGYIADYLRVNLPGESTPKLLTLLWLRDPGFSGTMGKFKSVLAIYDL